MTHEMVHLAFPSVPREHHWIEEGDRHLRRADCALTSRRSFAGDSLARTAGWPSERTARVRRNRGPRQYPHLGAAPIGGGALFCLIGGCLRFTGRTNNRYGLQDAITGKLFAAGGNMEHDWAAKLRALKAGGPTPSAWPVLTELYDQMKATPVNARPRCDVA